MARHVKISTIGCPNVERHDAGGDVPARVVAHLQRQIGQVTPQRPDLIVLPELCDVPADLLEGDGGKDRRLAYLEARREPVMALMRHTARQHHCYVVYPTLVAEGDRLFNAAILLDRAGDVAGRYDKCRPTPAEIELGIVPGVGPTVVACDFGAVGFAICFDLNFEELLAPYRALRPDLLVFPSMYHGGLMQAYWAYSCRAHLVSAVETPNLLSEIHLPTGDVAATSSNYFNFTTAVVNLDCAVVHLDGLFSKLDVLRAAYGPGLRIHDPGRLGSVLLSAESDDLSIQHVIDTHKLELLDAYLERSRATTARVPPGTPPPLHS